tara:strand:+ start:87 stop:1121 length:1035 start_codon:yes stop_codon:yes gene_type:complete
MTVNSESFFRKISSKDETLDERERKIKLREDRLFNLQQSMMSVDQINPEQFFEQGKQQGIEEGMQLGLQQAAESAEKFNQGGLVTDDGAYFEASIGRKDARDLKSNVVVESFFDTGKGRSSDFYEERTSDGTTLFRDKSELIGSSLTESSYSHTPTITETDEDGGVSNFTETETLSSRTSSIAKDDLIKHQDQLLGEIHKIKGFEDVTINDVLSGSTGLPKDTLFNILSNSDASFATAARTEEQNRMPTDYLVSSESNFTSEAETRYNSEGLVKADAKEAKSFSDLANSINQSVNTTRVKTVIQPINTITTKTVSVPSPTPIPVIQTQAGNVVSRNKKSIANKL